MSDTNIEMFQDAILPHGVLAITVGFSSRSSSLTVICKEAALAVAIKHVTVFQWYMHVVCL
jgi:2-succinyl-5-enolpyruvyl-6-hydroxy-3-cyclohexene-1-carboxylate synthase